MAFQVSKDNSRTKHYFANPRIAIQENVTRSLQKLLVALHLKNEDNSRTKHFCKSINVTIEKPINSRLLALYYHIEQL